MRGWMRRTAVAAAVAAAAGMAAQPCVAAPLVGERALVPAHVGAFAGGSIVLPLGGGRHAAPSARLRLSPEAAGYESGSGRRVQRAGAGLELGLAGGAPELRLAGERPAALKQRLGFKGSTGYIVAGGAVVVAVLLLAAVASASPKPGPRPGDFGP